MKGHVMINNILQTRGEQGNFQLDDDEVRFVLDQHA
jgi:hypothetical protein